MQIISIQNSIIVIFQIDEVTLGRRGGTLACCRFKGEHNFLRIAELLEGVFASYAIPHDKIVSTVTDNGSNFVKAFKEFGANLTSPMHATAEDDAQSQNGSDDEAEDDEAFVPSVIEESADARDDTEPLFTLPNHMRCAAHTLSLIATTDAKLALKTTSFFKHSSFCYG